MDSKALTKVQSAFLTAVVVVAAVGGGAGYVLWRQSLPPPEDIRVGFCGDLDNVQGKNTWQGAVLAAEQINAEGGILGRNITIIAEDDDDETPPFDVVVASNALTKLIAVDKADYIVTPAMGFPLVSAFQDICAERKKILFAVRAANDEFTQRVLDDYDRYKYSFRAGSINSTVASAVFSDQILTLGNYTGFTKVAYIMQDSSSSKEIASKLNETLPEHGFEIVYRGMVSIGTTDFTSNFAAMEASGAELLLSVIMTQAGIPFVKEWHDRQSPVVVCGLLPSAQESNFWALTEGKCDTVSFNAMSATAGYPLTNKTLLTREAYMKRWGEVPAGGAVSTYDTLRFILPDAIERAGTTETEAVIKALEETDIETSHARHFVFTASHDTMLEAVSSGGYSKDHMLACMFQWQNGTMIPVYPKEIMEEAGATYKYPEWDGPWNEAQIS